MYRTQKLVTGAVFIAFGIVLPMSFHFTGLPGSVFLPMHIPVLVAGMFLGAKTGFAIGVLTPVLSSITTGMPPLMPTLPRMTAELGVYGLAGGYFYKNKKLPLSIALVSAMLLGRVAVFIMDCILIMFLELKIDAVLYLKASTLYAAPGIIIQLFLVPVIVRKLETIRARNAI